MFSPDNPLQISLVRRWLFGLTGILFRPLRCWLGHDWRCIGYAHLFTGETDIQLTGSPWGCRRRGCLAREVRWSWGEVERVKPR